MKADSHPTTFRDPHTGRVPSAGGPPCDLIETMPPCNISDVGGLVYKMQMAVTMKDYVSIRDRAVNAARGDFAGIAGNCVGGLKHRHPDHRYRRYRVDRV
jgi:hypothetical protein